MATLNIYEIMEQFEKAPTKAAKQEVLRKNMSWTLECVLRGTYNPGVVYNVKEIPPYKPNDDPVGLAYSNMTSELGRIYIFEKGNPKRPAGLTEKRQEQLLIQILECLEPKESVIFSKMLMKKPLAKGLTGAFVEEMYPQLVK